ncbi:MAG: hypothetical protein KDJ52_32225 [Anaerolineae bacterium]|nr:hypothetical protein [Anaerolineae bacterium]
MASQFSLQAEELGQSLGQWKVRGFHSLSYYIWGGLLSIFGACVVLSSLKSLFNAEEVGVGVFACWGTFGLIVGGLGLAGGIKAFIERDLGVQVFSEGLIYTKSGKHTLVRWDDIAAVWQEATTYKSYGVTTYTMRKFTIQLQDGRKFRFDNIFEKVESLGETIQNQVTKHQLPQAIQSLKKGATVSFGEKLAVSAQGLSNSNEIIPWSQVQSVRVNQGVITVQKQGKWLNWSSVKVANTPNVFVFLALVETILSSSHSPA